MDRSGTRAAPIARHAVLVMAALAPAVMRATTAAYVSRIRPGPWLMISAGHAEDAGPNAELRPAYTAADAFRHTHEEFTSFFAGTEIVPPGIAEARRWIAGLTAPLPDHGLYVRWSRCQEVRKPRQAHLHRHFDPKPDSATCDG